MIAIVRGAEACFRYSIENRTKMRQSLVTQQLFWAVSTSTFQRGSCARRSPSVVITDGQHYFGLRATPCPARRLQARLG